MSQKRDNSTKAVVLVLLGVALLILATATESILGDASKHVRRTIATEGLVYTIATGLFWGGVVSLALGFVVARAATAGQIAPLPLKRKSLLTLALGSLIAFLFWCYYPHQDANTIGSKLGLRLPGLYSSCIARLARIGTPEAVDLLRREWRTRGRARRVEAAKALLSTKWRPADRSEQASFLVLSGRYEEAAALGQISIDPLVEEFKSTDQPEERSRICALLLKSGDPRGIEAVQNYLHEKLARIGAIVKTALPLGAHASTSMEALSPTARRVVISGHLLEGESPDDKRPYVRGNYGTRESLESKAKSRAYQIYQSIFREVSMTEFESVVVQCRHGVRVQTVPFGFATLPGMGGTDQSMMIFQTSVAPATAQKVNWRSATLADVQRIWTIEENEIPSLQFIAVR